MEDPNSQMIDSKLDSEEEYQTLLEKYGLDVDTKIEKINKLHDNGFWDRRDIEEWITKDTDLGKLTLEKIIKLASYEISNEILDDQIGYLVEEIQLNECN